MKIVRQESDGEHSAVIRSHLEALFGLRGEAARPCGPVCVRPCPQCGSRECRCSCSRDCPEIVYALSSDPLKFPVEPGIAPLVYELKRLGVFHPCWSCEGHDGSQGSQWTAPAVWFYSRSVVHIRLLADGLAELHMRRIIASPWVVRLTFSEADNPDTMFALQPDMRPSSPPSLESLRDDVATIAKRLHSLVTGRARVLYRHA